MIVPVAYYVHRRKLPQNYRTSTTHATDRAALRLWVLRTLVLPGIWGSGLDTLIRDLRAAIDEHEGNGFPTTAIEQRMEARGKPLNFSDAVIDELLTLSYGKRRTFALLALLFPHVDTRNVHHVDHIFPVASLHKPKLKALGYSDAEIEELQTLRDQLPNLQLLEGPHNIAKSAQDPQSWAAAEFAGATALGNYLSRNALPNSLPATATDFRSFFDARRTLLIGLVRKMVSA